MKFIKLMKNELFKKKQKKNNFRWAIDESKYLNLKKIESLRNTCEKARDLALKRGKATAIREWFMIELGLFTGLRVKEMADLKCGDLHIQGDESSLRVRNGKGNKPRTVCLKQEFKYECRWFLKWKKKSGQSIDAGAFLFTNSQGRQLTKRALQKAFKRCIAKAGLDSHYSIHCLRHTFGAYLYKSSNHNLRLVQEQLGHSSVKTTEVYASLMDTDAKEAVEILYKR